MRRLYYLIVPFLFLTACQPNDGGSTPPTTTVVAQYNIHLTWDASFSEADPKANLKGYRVYWGSESRWDSTGNEGKYDFNQDAGLKHEYFLKLGDGKWYFAVTAFNDVTESIFSDEVFAVLPWGPVEIIDGKTFYKVNLR